MVSKWYGWVMLMGGCDKPQEGLDPFDRICLSLNKTGEQMRKSSAKMREVNRKIRANNARINLVTEHLQQANVLFKRGRERVYNNQPDRELPIQNFMDIKPGATIH